MTVQILYRLVIGSIQWRIFKLLTKYDVKRLGIGDLLKNSLKDIILKVFSVYEIPLRRGRPL